MPPPVHDRVRFLTWNDTGTPANSSGANGFTTPFLAAGGALFPAAVPYDQVISWYWRNRLFQIASTDLSITAGALTGSVTTGDMTGGQLNAAGSSMTSEIQHVARGANGPRTSGAWGPSGDATGGMTLNLFLDGVNDCPAIYFDGSDYFPVIAITGAFSVIDGGNSITLNFSTDPGSVGGTPDGSFGISFDGIPLVLYYKAVSVSGDGAFSFSDLNLTTSTSANSYWTYKNLAGQPIYSDTTGSILNDPTG